MHTGTEETKDRIKNEIDRFVDQIAPRPTPENVHWLEQRVIGMCWKRDPVDVVAGLWRCGVGDKLPTHGELLDAHNEIFFERHGRTIRNQAATRGAGEGRGVAVGKPGGRR